MTGTVVGDGPHDGVADEVGEADLAAPGAAEVAVDDLAVDLEQLGRDVAEAGGGRDGEARLHVRDDAGRRAAERLALGGRGGGRLGVLVAGAAAGAAGVGGEVAGAGGGGSRSWRRAGPLPAGAVAGADAGRWAAPCGRRRGGSRRRSPASSRSPTPGRRGTARTSRRRARRWDPGRHALCFGSSMLRRTVDCQCSSPTVPIRTGPSKRSRAIWRQALKSTALTDVSAVTPDIHLWLTQRM